MVPLVHQPSGTVHFLERAFWYSLRLESSNSAGSIAWSLIFLRRRGDKGDEIGGHFCYWHA